MKRTVTIAILVVIFFAAACGKQRKAGRLEPKGGVFFGGTLRVNETEKIKNLLPYAINELNAYHVASQVYEGLVKYNPFDLGIEPALARSWEVSSDKTEYTFHLRQDVKFHNDSCFDGGEGRTVNATDVRYAFERLCTKSQMNAQYEVTLKGRVLGAEEGYQNSSGGRSATISGLTVVDDSTIKIKLVQPDANFLNILAMPGCYIYPREAEKRYGLGLAKAVGTGPFYIVEISENSVVMCRNEEYWGYDKHGNQLPYLDSITWSFINNRSSELAGFNAGKLDMVYNVNAAMVANTLAQRNGALNFDIYSSPALTTEYYCFNVQKNPFFSLREVRQAFNLAIDRQKLVEVALKGEGRAAGYGLVPYTEVFEKSGYQYKAVKAYPYNPDSARKLLTAIGYVNGKGLPDFNLEINDGGGDRNLRVATEVQRMLLENIGVKLTISVVPWRQHQDNIQMGRSDFFRYTWISDYPDPESFLTLFFGKNVPENFEDPSYINLGHFKNAAFDSIYLQARAELDKTRRYRLYSQAEQILMQEAGLVPLFYDENMRLVKKDVKNLTENPLIYMDFSVVYKQGRAVTASAQKQ